MKYELEPNNRGRPDEELMADLRLVAKRLGQLSVSKDQYGKHGRFSPATIQKRFGSWNEALLRSGLGVAKRNSIPCNELLDDLIEVAKRQETRTLTTNEYTRLGKFSVPTIQKAFGSWGDALSAAGLAPSTNWHPKVSDEALVENLAEVWEMLGRQPKTSDLRPPISKFSSDSYARRFGSWRKALEIFVELANSGSIPEHAPHTAPVAAQEKITPKPHRTPRNPSWRLRFLTMRRDGFSCQVCGRSPANEAGVILHVDHIIPWSKGGETILENLQTLCEPCNIGKSDLPMTE
ncbi:MAG: HNH endonuclease [Parvularculaceae bacterium]